MVTKYGGLHIRLSMTIGVRIGDSIMTVAVKTGTVRRFPLSPRFTVDPDLKVTSRDMENDSFRCYETRWRRLKGSP